MPRIHPDYRLIRKSITGAWLTGISTFAIVWFLGCMVNWEVGNIWLYLNLDTASSSTVVRGLVLYGIFPPFIYALLGFQKAADRFTSHLYEKIFVHWIKEAIHQRAEQLINIPKGKEADQQVQKLKTELFHWLNQKTGIFPPTTRNLIRWYGIRPLKKVAQTEIQAVIQRNWSSTEELEQYLLNRSTLYIRRLPQRAFPIWMKILIPLNVLLLIGLFLFT